MKLNKPIIIGAGVLLILILFYVLYPLISQSKDPNLAKQIGLTNKTIVDQMRVQMAHNHKIDSLAAQINTLQIKLNNEKAVILRTRYINIGNAPELERLFTGYCDSIQAGSLDY